MKNPNLLILVISILIVTVMYISYVTSVTEHPRYYIDTADDLLDKTLNHT